MTISPSQGPPKKSMFVQPPSLKQRTFTKHLLTSSFSAWLVAPHRRLYVEAVQVHGIVEDGSGAWGEPKVDAHLKSRTNLYIYIYIYVYVCRYLVIISTYLITNYTDQSLCFNLSLLFIPLSEA